MDWFTSDTHIGHKMIAGHRGFGEDTYALDEEIIKVWSDLVKEEDNVYHLGDVSMTGSRRTAGILYQLPGKIHLIKGNHDKPKGAVAKRFESIQDYLEIRYKGVKLILSHYPILSWNNMHHGSLHLHGHCHGNLRKEYWHQRRLDVGWDIFRRPISGDEVLTLLYYQPHISVDHHKL